MAIPSNQNIKMIENTSFEFLILGTLLSFNFKTPASLIRLSCAGQVLMLYYILTRTNKRDPKLVFGADLLLQSLLFEVPVGCSPSFRGTLGCVTRCCPGPWGDSRPPELTDSHRTPTCFDSADLLVHLFFKSLFLH